MGFHRWQGITRADKSETEECRRCGRDKEHLPPATRNERGIMEGFGSGGGGI
jgi:hypothetical protein